jgi:hypothetical protein
MMCPCCRFSTETIIVSITLLASYHGQKNVLLLVNVAKVPAKNLHNLPGNVTDSQCVLFVRWLAGFFMVYTTSTCRDLPSSGDGMARRDVNICKDCKGGQRKLAN